MTTKKYIKTCLHCGELKPVTGRGLCSNDHHRATTQGWLERYPRITRTAADFVADYQILKQRGLTNPEIAVALGYSVKSIGRTLTRARSRGLL